MGTPSFLFIFHRGGGWLLKLWLAPPKSVSYL